MPGTSESNSKKKITVLGGGPASLATVWYMLKNNNWDLSNYDVTVYQLGWRLGGKCANGRNKDNYYRIEEHGIHFWFGCYHNSWELIKELYEHLPKTGYKIPFTWYDAFTPSKAYVGFEQLDYGWDMWRIQPPAWPVPPGEVDIPYVQEGARNKPLADVMRDAMQVLTGNFHENIGQAALVMKNEHRDIDTDDLSRKVEEIEEAFIALLSKNKLGIHIPGSGIVLEFIEMLDDLCTAFMNAFGDFLDHHIEIRKLFVVVNLGLTILKGMLIDNVFYDGFDVINEYDFIEWLRMHGASEITLGSTLTRSYYDGAFAFRYGDKTLPDSEAGTTLKGLLFAFATTNQSMFWKMNGGLGEILFAPLYLVLKYYGVKFEFFHRVDHLRLSDDKKSIASIEFGRQVNIADGLSGYDPLVDIKGVKCWLTEPKYECLKEGAELQRLQNAGLNVNLESFWTEWPDVGKVTLQAGTDFDEIVFGISAGSVPYLCNQLIEANTDWQNVAANIKTVQTQSVQLWMNRSATELGWPFDDTTIYTTFYEPLDTWASAKELIKYGKWPDLKPKDVFYFVGVMHDPGIVPPPTFHRHPAFMKQMVFDYFLEFLMKYIDIPFPRTKSNADESVWFNWGLLYDFDRQIGHRRLNSQYFRANIDPSERYVLTVKGSSKYRFSPGNAGFTNLIVTGDWTKTFLNTGCFEAAIMSAIEAASAVTGHPPHVSYDKLFSTNPKY